MKKGDFVFVIVVNTVGIDPASQTISDTGNYYVSDVSATTGAGTIVAVGAT